MKNANPVVLVALALAIALVHGGAFAEPELGEVAFHQALLDVGTDLRLMCVAAHPDDEDGATLALYRKKFGYKTIALIATRGEGGQNEIGPELYNALGVIRTHEMKRAAEITGAELHFLDLPEFGYSKTGEEAFAVWGRNEALRRMVRKIRETRPDVIITHHGPTGGHGHHQAIGQTLLDAFDAAADPARFPEQIAEGLGPWQAARLYQRSWRGGGEVVAIHVGELDDMRGLTYAEIAGQALAEHESQGMAMFAGRFASARRPTSYSLKKQAPGGVTEAGSIPAPGGALFAGLNDRVFPSARRLAEDRPKPPEAMSRASQVLGITSVINSEGWRRANAVMAVAMQLQLKARISDPEVVAGQEVTIEGQFKDFGEADAKEVTFSLVPARWMAMDAPAPVTKTLSALQEASVEFKVTVPKNQKATIPHPEHLFDDHFLEPQFTVVANLDFVEGGRAGVELRASVLMDVAPEVSLEFVGAPYLVRRGDTEARFELLMTNHSPGAKKVTVTLSTPDGFSVESEALTVAFAAEGDQKMAPITAQVVGGLDPRDYVLKASVAGTDVMTSGTARLVDLEVPRDIRVGVIESYDDTFMTTLTRLKVPHEALGVGDFTAERLDTFSTIIVDIRAYLVRPDLVANNQALLDYVHRGGTAIVMYHKTYEWKKEFAPYPLQLSRNRVTVEEAPITLLEPGHSLFTTPNRIVEGDWDGWRQERGLYFPSKWDDRYTPLIDCADPGEDPPPGSCLIAAYGEGTYLYTALGWYRQLRELHPGTLRVFANMLAL